MALPSGDIVVAYQNGLARAATTDVVMKRATFAALPATVEQAVAATAGSADQSPYAVLADDQVVFFTQQASTSTWRYRRYRHTDSTFIDADPRISRRHHRHARPARRCRSRRAGLGRLRRRRQPATDAHQPGGWHRRNTTSVPAAGTLDVFVLGISPAEALVFWHDAGGLRMIGFSGTAWGTPVLIDLNDSQPAAVRDADGTVFLLSVRPTAEAGNEIFLRLRNPVTGEWGQPQRVIAHPGNDLRPYPVLVPGQGIWVLWMSDRNGDFDLFAKRLITAI